MSDSSERQYTRGFRLIPESITHADDLDKFVSESNVFQAYSNHNLSYDAWSVALELVQQEKVGTLVDLDSEQVRDNQRDTVPAVNELVNAGFAEWDQPRKS